MPEKFRRLFEGPDEIDYTPDPMGRIGEGAREIRDPAVDEEGQQLFQDFRNAWAERRALPDLFGSKGTLDLKDGIGLQARNRRPDVAKVETFLDLLGEHDAAPTEGPTGYYSMRLEDSLKAFQAKNGLAVDGAVKPRGETLGRIKQDLSKKLGPAALKPQRPKPPRPAGTPSSVPGRSLQSEVLKGPLDGADLPKAPDGGATLIPVQAAGGPPAIGRKPPPTHRQAERHSELKAAKQVKEFEAKYRRLVARAKWFNNNVPGVNLDRTIAGTKRYLDGVGGVVRYDPDWLRDHAEVRTAQDRVLGHFANWMKGKPLKPGSPSPSVIGKILALKSNGSLDDGTDRSAFVRFERPSLLKKFSDLRLASGTSNIKGIGRFRFTRKGNIIRVTGTIQQNWRDVFDFTPGAKTELRIEGMGMTVDHDEMIFLHRMGRAKPFRMRSTWNRAVTGEIRIAKDPRTGKDRIVGVTLKWAD
jgi:peptidoglycan hydrolase-like protein with peptidoglycan-binding domain